MKDRSHYPTRIGSLADSSFDEDLRYVSMADRLAMVWPMTVDAWAMVDPNACEQRLQRHVVRISRGES